MADNLTTIRWDVTFNTTLFLVVSTIVVIAVFIYNKLTGFEGWEKYGVKQVSTGLRELPTLMFERLMKEHGPTVGIVRGTPILVTRDLNILKQVMVKDFSNFVNRSENLVTKSPLNKGLFFLKDVDWKRIRQLSSPSFSTGKLKQMIQAVKEAAESLAKAFETCAHNSSNIKVLHTTGQYSSSIIAKTAFGVQVDSIGQEEDDQFTYMAKHIFKRRSKFGITLIVIMLRFRHFRKFLVKMLNLPFFDPCSTESSDYFSAILRESVKEREKAELSGGCRHNDFLQSLVSVKLATDAAAAKNKRGSSENGTVAPPLKSLTMDEVIGQSFLTILAAFETTATTLHFCMYNLADNPDIQEKVYTEIMDVVGQDSPTHEHLQQLHYMDQVLNETLRLFPPLTNITRVAQETRTYGNITIPAGAVVTIPIREIHRDPNNYPEPEVFNPERFSEEGRATRNPLAFQPFGGGPRLCIGMRLAYLEMKMALVYVLRKVRLELNEKTVPCKGEGIKVTFINLPRTEIPIELSAKLREEF